MTAVATILAVALELTAWRIVTVAGVILLNQLSVGWSNDWLDAERDRAVGRRDKPVARGDISAETVRNAALVALVVSVLLAFLLGPAAGLAHAVFVGSAWAYNLRLKNTAASVLPYVVSFGILPAVVGLGAERPSIVAWWALVTGALLGIAAHFANVLPDLDDDSRTGIRGLPHRLGRTASGLMAFGALALGSLAASLGSGVPYSPIAIAGLVAGLAIAAIGGCLAVLRPPGRLLFQLIMLSALIIVTMLAVSGQRLLAEY